jgi:hypothetical protein
MNRMTAAPTQTAVVTLGEVAKDTVRVSCQSETDLDGGEVILKLAPA